MGKRKQSAFGKRGQTASSEDIRDAEQQVREFYRSRHQAIPEEAKLAVGIRLNIYDAARSYGEAHGLKTREVLQNTEFRSAWQQFRGGGLKGGKPTSFDEKMAAARVLGWAPPRDAAIERLRGTSP